MLSPETLHTVNHEKYKDLLRELEQDKLARLTKRHKTDVKLYSRAAGLLGTQMVKLGQKLQSYDAPAPSKRVATKI